MKIPNKVDVKGFEGLYYVTPEAEVYRKGRKKPLMHKINRKNNQVYVKLTVNYKEHNVYLKTIMRNAFFDSSVKYLANKNGMTTDCSYWNLVPTEHKEACTPKITCRRSVVKITDDNVVYYKSIQDCSKDNPISASTLSRYCHKKQEAIYGVRYLFAEDYEKEYEQ